MSQPPRALIAASELDTGAAAGTAFAADATFAGNVPSTPGFAPGGGAAGCGETGGAAATTGAATGAEADIGGAAAGAAGDAAGVSGGSLRTVATVVMFAGLETAGAGVS